MLPMKDKVDPKRFKSFYMKEASVYHKLRYETRYGRLFRRLHHGCINDLLKPLDKKMKLLEVACGTGHTSALLANLGFRMTACDLTSNMLVQAKHRVAELDGDNVDFIETNAMVLPFKDSVFDILVSTRFLHLFPIDEQKKLLVEMLRVLKPGGYILVDFDNWSSRWLMMVPFLFYNILLYKRIAPFSIYNKINPTKIMIENLGLKVESVLGVGGTHLIFPMFFSENIAEWLGKKHRKYFLRIFAEQFMIFGVKI